MTSKLNHIVFGSSDTQNPGHDDRRPPKDDTDDSSGNMTYDGLNTLVYDAENHTVSATNSSSSGTYVYDGNGLRVQKCVPNCTSPTTTVVFVYSGSLELAEYYKRCRSGESHERVLICGRPKGCRGLLVSMFSWQLLNWTPSDRNSSNAKRRCLVERANRSKRHTTIASNCRLRASSISLLSSGRESFAPNWPTSTYSRTRSNPRAAQ